MRAYASDSRTDSEGDHAVSQSTTVRRRIANGTNVGYTDYLQTMKALGRLSLIVGFLALQLTSLAGGPGCALPMGESTATGSDMRAMTMDRTPDTDAPESPRPHAPAPAQACTTMAPCVYASAAAFVDSPVTLMRAPRRVIVPVRDAAPADVVVAPETPPPRA